MRIKPEQHDDHIATWQLHEWKDWPHAEDEVALEVEANRPIEPEDEPSYVIARSDSIVSEYWQDDIASWGPLRSATYYGRDDVQEIKTPLDGFWMDARRAEELEA